MTLKLFASQLSSGTQGDDVVRLHRALQALGRSIPASEARSRVLGPGTTAVVRALQEELALPATGIVDAATVRTINVLLDKLATDPRIVRGSVRDADRKLLTAGFVQIFLQATGGETVLGKSPLRDGAYEISYQLPSGHAGKADLRVAVLDDNGIVETTPSGASILTDADRLEVVDFALSGAAHPPSVEFDALTVQLKPLAGTRDLADLTEDEARRDISLLASQGNRSLEQVAALVRAHQLAKETGTPAPVLYGMLRQGLPADAAALHALHPDERVRALQSAVQQGLVPAELGGRKIEDHLDDFLPSSSSPLRGLLGRILDASELDAFVRQYHANRQSPSAFWQQVAADPRWAARAAELKFTAQLGVLTNNHDPLVTALKTLPEIRQPSDLARITKAQWRALVARQGIGVPADTPGATADEKADAYVKEIVAEVEAAFPTQFVAERLGTSRVATFLKAAPSYDLKSTYPEQFFKAHPAAAQSLQPADRKQLQNFQRLYRLTENAEETIGLAGKGLHSAQQIARIDRKVFAEQHADVLPQARANAVYDRALRANAVALALFSEHSAALNRTATSALPRVDSEQQAVLAADSIPDWQSLFGTFDLCACQDCVSVHSPAAYFVDVLRFLGERNVRALLLERRPDLGDIELSCENTNTPVPLVDLVNEILEDAVAPPAPFAAATLDPALEAELAQPVATTALAAAFVLPLESGARVEALEPGKRWRVWDQPFAYSVVKDAGALKVVARSRQTSGSATERRAMPQYRNSEAYAELARSVYPWTLPFDLPHAEARVLLEHLRAPRRELIEALRPAPEPFAAGAPGVIRLAAERLGLTDTERRILVGEPLTPPRQPEDFWGSVPLAQLITVQRILDRSSLGFSDLEALLATWFVNPQATLAVAVKAGEPADSCDTEKLEVAGLTMDALTRLHRFVRLWRKLGWTLVELDRVLRALLPAGNAPALDNEVLVRLDHLQSIATRLRLPVLHALALWHPIDTAEPRSLYAALFYNPAVFKPQDEAFRLRADGQELVHADALLDDQAAALQAAFRLDAAGFALLRDRTDGKLTLANLSFLLRHATLARQLNVNVHDLVTAIELTALDPFRADRSHECIRFVDAVQAVRASGLTLPRLDYLVRHRFTSASSFAPDELTLAQALTGVRAALQQIEATSDAERQKLRRSSVIDRIAAAIELSADVTGSLLTRLRHAGTAGQDILEALATMGADPLSRDNARPQFEVLEKLMKVAGIVEALQLPGSLLDWLLNENPWLAVAPDPLPAPVAFAQWYSLVQLRLLRDDRRLEDAALEAILTALDRVARAADAAARLAARTEFADALSRWLGWRNEDVAALVGPANDLADRGLLLAEVPTDYHVDLVVRLSRAMRLLQRLGVGAAEASAWCDPLLTAAHANAIRRAAKVRYDDENWFSIAVPLQNGLRDLAREALAGYLSARPERWGSTASDAGADALYAHFLIDTEMSACQLTSRTKQAISSLQLFVQRCLMGLEPGVPADDPKWAQWAWMKNFRVWEANRKIWLYPENWIEPQLRDNKTPFFKELEDELLQSDLDDAMAEQALRRYVEKIDEVARLAIVGVYEDDEGGDLCVFGRTLHTPHTYYFRRRMGRAREWQPWERMELDIEGNHLIPVIWNRKLMVIWPVVADKAKEKPVVMPPQGEPVATGERYYEIQLAWSEYQNGRWTGKNLSAPAVLQAYQGDDRVLFGRRVAAPQNTAIFMQAIDDGGLAEPFDDGPVVDPGDSPPTPTGGPAAPRQLVAQDLFFWKGLVVGDSLRVRGFLRRDYRGTLDPADVQAGCCFGEFRFVGCRKIVTAAHRGKVSGLNHPLAPRGTRFDHMQFTSTASGLTLLDGKFPVGPAQPDATVLGEVNEFESIAGDPSSSVVNRIDIPVLDRAPGSLRVLAPHQDLQFVCDRPFFVMDDRRTFLATSIGASGKVNRPKRGDWVVGDLAVAWRADYFPQAVPALTTATTLPVSAGLQPLSLLVRGADGRRVAKRLPPIALQPRFQVRTLLPTFWTTREYTFANFHHPYLCDLVKKLSRQGIPGLLSHAAQSLADPQSFAAYAPGPRVREPHPIDEVEFQAGRAYELYNWELFFHIPLLIADQLSKNQRFEEAQRWFHFVFDPTGTAGGDVPQRYWRTKPFHDRLAASYAAESVKALEELIAKGPTDELKAAVEVWRSNPFSPHAVARLRTTAYQKTVVMKYIDNLIAWGDQLFRRETLESINEATHLYVLAAEILGRRPEVIRRSVQPALETFTSLEPKLGELGNALEQIELLVPDAGDAGPVDDEVPTPDAPSAQVLYFCVPENVKLLGYWDTVADRLFKIRHCMNIEGQVRELPLFDLPIDPALLVRARAAGLSIGEVLSEVSVSLPHYRFSVLLRKATEVLAEVRNLASSLLAAMEKRDAEALSTLRSGQELRLLEAIRDIRSKHVDEARALVEGLERSRESLEVRKAYLDSRELQSEGEQASAQSLTRSQHAIAAKLAWHALAAVLVKLGKIKMGSPTTAGVEVGGGYFAAAMNSMAAVLDTGASILTIKSQLESRLAEHHRRKDEWDHQAALAGIELKQIDKQIAAAGIRLAIAERELTQHERQIDDARDVDGFLRSKFTSRELYQWTIGQVSGIYFQSYQLAYDLAKRAELCLQHELGLKYGETSFIRFGYWDSLKKGLLAGDHLAHDLKRLDVAYLEGNVREYELTRHVSLMSLAPTQLIALKETGACEFAIPEWLLDLDTPGHYMRRIKMVSITIPCVTGPYTTIHCKARLLGNAYRRNAELTPDYARRPADDPAGPDERFVDDRMVLESIVTSTGQNDAGLFEPSMGSERYLPFEGAGAISRWRLELPTEFRTFDYDTISDVIVHLRYTARDGGDQLRSAATAAVTQMLADATTRTLFRLLSLRHEFPAEWHRFVSAPPTATNVMSVDVQAARFPYFAQARTIAIREAHAVARAKSGVAPELAIAPGLTPPAPGSATWSGQEGPGPWTISTSADPKSLEDAVLILAYTI